MIANTDAWSGPEPLPEVQDDARLVGYWLSLGLAAGALGGLVVGGVLGRLAMFLLRLTSDHSVRGLQSDDDFTIGRFDFISTLNLLGLSVFLGTLFSLFVLAGRPFFPSRWMPAAWAVAGGLTGGAEIVHRDGIDFTRLEPHLLAIALFVALPALGAATIALLIDYYPRFWMKSWRKTVAAGLVFLAIPFWIPAAVVGALGAALWLLAMRVPPLRLLPRWRPARIAALVVFSIVSAVGLWDLVGDSRALL